MADLLISKTPEIMVANQRDLEQAEVDKIESSVIDRLKLTDAKIASLAAGKHFITIQTMLQILLGISFRSIVTEFNDIHIHFQDYGSWPMILSRS